jgi:hypothetical protein
MAWQAECMRDDGSFGAWLRPWRIVPEFVFTFTFTVFLCCGLYNDKGGQPWGRWEAVSE